MKLRFALFLILTILVGIAGCGSKESFDSTPPSVKIFQIPKAKVTYAYSGNVQGKKILTIAAFGKYLRDDDERTETQDSVTTSVHLLSIIRDTVTWTVDLKKKEGMKMRRDPQMLENLKKEMTKEELENLNASTLLKMGAKLEGRGTVLGKECDIYSLMHVKVWLWKGILLMQRAELNGVVTEMKAVSIDTEFEPTSEMFMPPADVKISDASSMGQMPPGHP